MQNYASSQNAQKNTINIINSRACFRQYIPDTVMVREVVNDSADGVVPLSVTTISRR